MRVLNRVADVGNRLPDPSTLFALLAIGVMVLSAVLAGQSVELMERDGTMATREVQSLLGSTGIRWIFDNMILNFTSFAPLGSVLTVMLGIGIAERTGLIAAGLRYLVQSVPASMMTATLVFAGVMSSMAADAGYVVLTPLGAVLFAGLGRHPLAGLAAAFAGVSGGFSANLLITGLDPLLAGLSTEAARMVDPEYTVYATANWYFMVASTFLITLVGTLVTTRIVEPMLGPWNPANGQGGDNGAAAPDGQNERPEHPDVLEPSVVTSADVAPAKSFGVSEQQAFVYAMGSALLVLLGIVWLATAGASPLRDPVEDGQAAMDALHPFFEAIELLIAVLFAVPAVVFGWLNGTVRSDRDVARMMTETMATMGAYIVLAFAAAQFVAFFNWTNLGAVTAVRGADLLVSLQLTGFPLLLAFIVVSALMNLVMGSASAKWAFMAPIFVPMLMMMGFSPEATQAAYRVGDSVTNVISPLLPYVPIIIIFGRRYDRNMGMGTLMATMLPYSVAFAIAWTALLGIWLGLDIPLGPGVSASWSAGQ
jgi:aminobenzoyl-glutamate transport protein